ncbi:MAG: acyl-CoA synthetase [Solirubrobacteraceae bacterium]
MRRATSELDLQGLIAGAARLAGRAADEAHFAAACVRAGMVGLEPPQRIAQMALAFQRHGMLAALVTVGAVRNGERVAIRDERGDVTYRELDEHTNALANEWRARGLQAGDGVAILVRNHRGFLEAVFAAAKCGTRIVLLNTSFAGPQIRDVAAREGTDLLVYDDEFSELVGQVEPRLGRWRAWSEVDVDMDARDGADPTLASLIEIGSAGAVPKPASPPRIVILTSGTTGTPKGAPRPEPKSLGLVGGLLGMVPFRARETTELTVPLFHAFGLTSMAMGLALGSTLVLRRRFDPAQALDGLRDNRATAMVVVPVMLARILELGEEEIRARGLSQLRVIFVSGSALGSDLSRRAMSAFGPVVYDMYGSTEVAYATIATPTDMREEPGSVGTVVRGAVVKILDEHGREVPTGTTGRIFVGNSAQFEGYTGGETKEQIDGLMSSGDVGHFSPRGRLFVDGRDDEMIVSGGENVFPAEVEELLASHEAVREAAVIGVTDEQFGQRLKAFVALNGGSTLSEDDVKDHVRQNLARYKVPREVVFLDELPRNATGKVLKRALTASGDD